LQVHFSPQEATPRGDLLLQVLLANRTVSSKPQPATKGPSENAPLPAPGRQEENKKTKNKKKKTKKQERRLLMPSSNAEPRNCSQVNPSDHADIILGKAGKGNLAGA
jgi:hypothetical protein